MSIVPISHSENNSFQAVTAAPQRKPISSNIAARAAALEVLLKNPKTQSEEAAPLLTPIKRPRSNHKQSTATTKREFVPLTVSKPEITHPMTIETTSPADSLLKTLLSIAAGVAIMAGTFFASRFRF